MEKVVRRKKHGKGPRRLIWVLVCAALLAAAVFAAVRLNAQPSPVQLPEDEDMRGSLENRETEEIVRLTIRMKGKEPWTAVRGVDGKLRLENGADWTLDETLGSRIEDAMANIVYEAVLAEDPAEYGDHLADFGLDDPELVATVDYRDGQSVTLRFGGASGLADEDFHFMTVDGDGRLFAVATSLLNDLRVEEELLRPVEQPVIHVSRLDRITVRNGDGTVRVEWQLKGDILDADAAENWFLTAPVTYPADYDTMVNLKKNAGNLRLGIWIGEATEENLSACGLKNPSAVLELHLAAGTTGQITDDGAYDVQDWEESVVRLEIGGARSDLVDYVRWGNEIYTMNRFTLDTLIAAKPLDTVARYPVTVSLDTLSSLTVETEAGTTVYTLIREASDGSGSDTDGEAGVDEPASVMVRCLKNGEEIPYTAFEAAYERWLVVTVGGKLPADWEKQETHTKYSFRSVSGQQHTVELSRFDALHDAVTLDGCTLFYLIRNGIGELPEERGDGSSVLLPRTEEPSPCSSPHPSSIS